MFIRISRHPVQEGALFWAISVARLQEFVKWHLTQGGDDGGVGLVEVVQHFAQSTIMILLAYQVIHPIGIKLFQHRSVKLENVLRWFTRDMMAQEPLLPVGEVG